MLFQGVLETVKDMIFPVFCLGCRREGVLVCDDCLTTIDNTPIALCPVCHESQPFGMCCDGCRDHSSLDSHIAATTYCHGTLVAKMIEALKYQYVTDIVPDIHALCIPLCEQYAELFASVDMIASIPLHNKRLAERGFNQSELIAACIGAHMSIPVVSLLKRVRYTRQQASLDRAARIHNMDQAFACIAETSIAHSTVLLVDDVYTTGSTMQSAAQCLKVAGASSVIGMSIARG
jgi:ComF family protein